MSVGTLDQTPRRLATAFHDLLGGLNRWDLWSFIAWHDIRHRYRRSILGPFWLTISMGILVTALGILYAMLFRLELDEYLPFVASGFVVWSLISGLVSESTTVFAHSEGIIKQIKLPFSIYVYQMVARNFVIFAHNVVIYIIVAAVFAVNVGTDVLLSLVGLVLLAINGVATGLVLGIVCARFRDVPQIITNVLQLAFFMTPIIWKPSLLAERAIFLWMNPFYYYMECVRAPLLGEPVSALVWTVVVAMTLVWCTLAVFFFARFRHRIPYWI